MAYPFTLAAIDRINRIPSFINFVKKQGNVPIFSERIDLYRYIANSIGTVPIDYLEFGVHQGISIREWSQLNSHSESSFIGFDSFEGLPEAWDNFDAGAFSTGGEPPSIDDNRVHFIRGMFQDTLDAFLVNFTRRHRLIINNDSDLYSSTLYTLTKLAPLLVPGTVILFDEFDDVQHEFRAVQDFCAAYRKTFKVIAATDRFRSAALEVL